MARSSDRSTRRRHSGRTLAAPFLAGIDDAVKPQLGGARPLERFLARTEPLTLGERRRIVDQAILLLGELYVHLPMKRAMHGIDPVRKLELLRLRLPRLADDLSFHNEMSQIFMSLQDLHTNYLLPRPYNRAVAFLPFNVESCYEAGRRKCLVAHVLKGFRHPSFRPGVEIVHWNWTPIARAIELVGASNGGSNEAARRARGLARLTVRPMVRSLPPEEREVTIGYRSARGALLEIRLPWLVFALRTQERDVAESTKNPRAMALGFDLEGAMIGQAKKLLYAPQVVAAERRLAARATRAAGAGTDSTMPGVLEARAVRTAHGRFGYLRIRTFLVDDEDAFVEEVVRLVAALPQRGLIIDVRDNLGGVIMAGERILQLFTPRRIEPEHLQIRSTPLALELCRRNPLDQLRPWLESMRRADETGAIFSAGLPLTAPAQCNDVGQRYHGPVVLVSNALCYSTTDVFTAGFKDHAVGTILGTDENTGAGGANVWTHELLRRAFRRARRGSSPFRPLPKEAGLRVALRRTLRVGALAGTEVEELGVAPDAIHRMTREDLLHRNRDLIEHAGAILASKPVYCLFPELRPLARDRWKLAVTTENIDRLDARLSGDWLGSQPVSPARGCVVLEKPLRRGDRIELGGYRRGVLVAGYCLKAP